MKTLINIVKLVNGIEMHYRVEGKLNRDGSTRIEVVFVPRPCIKTGR